MVLEVYFHLTKIVLVAVELQLEDLTQFLQILQVLVVMVLQLQFQVHRQHMLVVVAEPQVLVDLVEPADQVAEEMVEIHILEPDQLEHLTLAVEAAAVAVLLVLLAEKES